jgi:metal-responsive CopG/Arc/MetJ family transcriptional regulator
MGKRKVNVTLPEELLAKLRERVPARGLSKYIAEATAARLAEEERAALRKRLKEQCLARANQDRRLAKEFFDAEQEAWDQMEA